MIMMCVAVRLSFPPAVLGGTQVFRRDKLVQKTLEPQLSGRNLQQFPKVMTIA
jgi:hypothetical protein